MYNRYIPQSDGSYRRSSIPDPTRQVPQQPRPKPHTPPPPPEKPQPACPRNCSAPRPQPRKPQPQPQGVGSFLRQLLPKDFDTGDLLVVLLLLLISADGCEDRSNSLLTLVLYLLL